MSNVEVTINKKSYKISCSEQEKNILESYVKKIEIRLAKFKEEQPHSFMRLNQETLFLVEILSLISETEDLKRQMNDLNIEISELHNTISNLSDTVKDLKNFMKKNDYKIN